MTISRLPISYCTNVHPGTTVAEVVAGLSEHTARAAQLLGQPIAAGLWFAASVAEELESHPKSLELLAQTLWQHDLTTYTLNTFPYGDFHSDRVKEQVYLPDWSTCERLEYTQRCARILSQLLPPESEGSLSTVPLGGAMNAVSPDFHERCIANLMEMADSLRGLRDSTGRSIRLAIEPEPHCHLSSTKQQTLPFFENLMGKAAAADKEAVAREYLGLCFDVCHQAVEFEDVGESIRAIDAAGIRINKVHISSAVELPDPANNAAGRAALRGFVEPRYLHQTFAELPDGTVASRVDLMLDDIDRNPPDRFMKASRWRVHFHVPVNRTDLGPLRTTHAEIGQALRSVSALSYAPHLEVETYTWPVMPTDGIGEESTLAERIRDELAATLELLNS